MERGGIVPGGHLANATSCRRRGRILATVGSVGERDRWGSIPAEGAEGSDTAATVGYCVNAIRSKGADRGRIGAGLAMARSPSGGGWGGVLRRRNTIGRSLRIVGGSSGGGWPPRSGGSFPGRLRRPPDAEPDRTYDPTPKNQIFWDFSVKKVPAAPAARHPGWPDQGSWSPPPSTPAGAPGAPTPTPAARVPHRWRTPSAATSRCLCEPRQGW